MEDRKPMEKTKPLTDEALDKVAGGVQAGSILKGGEGEFSDHKPEKEKKKKRSYL